MGTGYLNQAPRDFIIFESVLIYLHIEFLFFFQKPGKLSPGQVALYGYQAWIYPNTY